MYIWAIYFQLRLNNQISILLSNSTNFMLKIPLKNLLMYFFTALYSAENMDLCPVNRWQSREKY